MFKSPGLVPSMGFLVGHVEWDARETSRWKFLMNQ